MPVEQNVLVNNELKGKMAAPSDSHTGLELVTPLEPNSNCADGLLSCNL